MFEIVEVADTFHDGRLWSSSSITWMTYGDVIVHVVLMRPTDHLGGGYRVSIEVGGRRTERLHGGGHESLGLCTTRNSVYAMLWQDGSHGIATW